MFVCPEMVQKRLITRNSTDLLYTLSSNLFFSLFQAPAQGSSTDKTFQLADYVADIILAKAAAAREKE